MERVFGLVVVVWVSACGGGREVGGDRLAPGETSCGDVTCSAGQYCFADGLCENGCVSDANCLDNEQCVIDDTFFEEGSCRSEDGPVTASDPLDACEAACEDFQLCGLAPAEASQCIDDCAALSSSEQRAIGNCGGLSCDGTLDCLGVECLSDEDCSGGASCLNYACL